MYPVASATTRKRNTIPIALTRAFGSVESVVGVKVPPTNRYMNAIASAETTLAMAPNLTAFVITDRNSARKYGLLKPSDR